MPDGFDLKGYLAHRASLANAFLDEILKDIDEVGRVGEAMGYSLKAGGKRLRPVLCMAAAECVGGDPNGVLPAAAALEMIHTYSLIHDDLPAMDDDALRRGRPTCHVAFDEATAILAGDALLTQAFRVLAGAASSDAGRRGKWVEMITLFADAAGCRGMIQGQMRDITAEKSPIGSDELETIHRLKTGALIEASVISGARLGGGRRKQVEALAAYARHIGLAFQVADDILNVEGDPELMGKAAGTDASRAKGTYPALIGLQAAKAYAGQLVRYALQCLDRFDNKAHPLRAIARYIIERRR